MVRPILSQNPLASNAETDSLFATESVFIRPYFAFTRKIPIIRKVSRS